MLTGWGVLLEVRAPTLLPVLIIVREPIRYLL